MARTVAAAGAGLVLMHNRETVDPALDILDDVRRGLDRSLGLARAAGIADAAIALDPGIGFGKTPAQNLTILRRLDVLGAWGLPILVGVSRKRLFGTLLGTEPADRLTGTLAANCHAAAAGARCFRVHDVAPHREALIVLDAIVRA